MDTYQKIAKAIEYIGDNVKNQPELKTIAAQVYTSPHHFQRLFTDWAGVSPKKFLQYLTIHHAKKILRDGQSTLFETACETGLSGTSRLHDLFVTIEGMTPGEYSKGGAGLTMRYSLQQCQFGRYLVASTDKGINTLHFVDSNELEALHALKQTWFNANLREEDDASQQAVVRFFNRDFADSEKVRLHLKGSPFQLKVWEALLRIPSGSLATYSTVAALVDQPAASRAVGTAIGRNPVGYLIPCHRVIKSVGRIGDYRWGGTRKKIIIGWEACRMFTGAEAS